jgi:pimeloyl-ACP methyl ester carboxylesterase
MNAVMSDGTRLHFVERGVGSTLVFLHGFTLDHSMWAPQMEALSSGHRVIAYDARGFGLSEPPKGEPYRHCDDAAALIESLHAGPAIVVGHSIGAHQMLELTISRPDLVRGFIAICMSGPGVPYPDDVSKMFAEIRATAPTDLAEAKRIWSRGGWFAAARETPEVALALDRMLAEYSGWQWTHDNPVRSLVPPAAERLSEVRVPVLAITGGRDLAYNTAVRDALVRGIPHARTLHLERSGHMPNLEDPVAINRAIADFARDH